MDAMEQIRAQLMAIEGKVGNIDGKLDGIVREQTRIATELGRHLDDDREIHAKQDERLLNTVRDLTKDFASAIALNTQRLEAIDDKVREIQTARSTSEKWRMGIAAALGAASGYVSGFFSRWPWGLH